MCNSGADTKVENPMLSQREPSVSLDVQGRLLACERGAVSYSHGGSVGDFKGVPTWPGAGHVFLFMPLSPSMCSHSPFWETAQAGGRAMIPGVQTSVTPVESSDGEQADC